MDDQCPITIHSDGLIHALNGFRWDRSHEAVYRAALSAIESVSTIRHTRGRRAIKRENSRGGKLRKLEASVATLDHMQSKAVVETVEGVQRIRGLAGSGKTIVLALKAAYLHAQHPEWCIAVTFSTRSLKGYFRRLINNFVLEQTNEEPDWDNLWIVNAWGGPGHIDRDGIYHQFCRLHGIEYLDFRSASKSFGRSRAFSEACHQAVIQAQEENPLYDAILVDEAQDLPSAFLRICYKLLDNHKRLVYAYDELQNLSGESLPSPEEIFGKTADGSPKVPFEETDADSPRRDIILKKCYRNSRPVLATAHALGFGVYRETQRQSVTSLVQMFDHSQLWIEVGYQVKDGELRDGRPVTLQRNEDTSPKFLEEHSSIGDLVAFICFDSESQQAKWLAQSIQANLKEDELEHDDIIVINPDPLTTRSKVGPMRHRLFNMGISSHLAGVDTDPDIFFKRHEKSVTFTGIHRAKGNEAGMVYIINAQDCHSAAWNLASIRNRLFTAITRSKAWIRVLGVGSGMKELVQEYEKLKRQDFTLQFIYPTREQRQQLQIVHRDMTSAERKRLQGRQRSLEDLLTDLESGNVHIEDLDESVIDRLRGVLG